MEAQRFNHNYIGTEHILLGLVREGDGVAARVLGNLGIDLHRVRDATEFIIGRGDRQSTGDIGLTPRAKRVIELSVEEARRLDHHYIGTEHLLLGLLREGEGIAAGILESLSVHLEKVRYEVIEVLKSGGNISPGIAAEDSTRVIYSGGDDSDSFELPRRNSGVTRIHFMFDYSLWARNKLLAAMETLTEERVRDAEHKGAYGSIHDTLAHMTVSEWLWLKRCKGESPLDLPKGSHYPSIASIVEWWDGVHNEAMEYLGTLQDDQLEQEITYTAPDGKTRTRKIWHMLAQVTNHQTEHRAQIATILGSLGVEVPGTDLVVYLSEQAESE
jgi:uncharacterized damage-inducible protein DinB